MSKIERKTRAMIFISGEGTNLQEIIDGAKTGNISADLVGVVSNKESAFGLVRARGAQIDTKVVPSKGTLNVPALRRKVEDEFLNYIVDRHPDIIVLAGFMMILSDDFLREVQSLGIIAINLHPALLPSDGGEEVVTSLGTKIPALRGTHMIEEAYRQNFAISGVTVHQVLPGVGVDKGPIILRQEVTRDLQNDTQESWETKMHAVEHRVLTAALNRVIKVLEQGVDVSRGQYSWQSKL